MKAIKTLVDNMRDEMHDASKYADLALKNKDDDRELSSMYMELAKQELDHSDKEHAQAVRLINRFRDSGKTVPEAMQAVWDWEHEKLIEDRKAVEITLDLARK